MNGFILDPGQGCLVTLSTVLNRSNHKALSPVLPYNMDSQGWFDGKTLLYFTIKSCIVTFW